MKRVAILGVTGSIGRQALDVIRSRDDLELAAIAAHRAVDDVLELAARDGVTRIALVHPAAAAAAARFDGVVHAGEDGLVDMIGAAEPDIVLNAIVGAAGLDASLATLDIGATLALANKESLVAGGDLVMARARATGAAVVPVDSEHSALAQCLAGRDADEIASIVLTASGGPFRGVRAEELAFVGAEDALRHPTWSMGAKITIDSATLANKGLEVIEAHHLFGLPYDQIDVVVHPQSVVHGLVRLVDGALLAHLGAPDMRVPISYALSWPARSPFAGAPFDLTTAGSLTFEPPDLETFRCLALARAAGEASGTAPCVMNAANEVAVAAFLDGRCGFLEIADLIEHALASVPPEPVREVETIRAADGAARAAVADRLAVRA